MKEQHTLSEFKQSIHDRFESYRKSNYFFSLEHDYFSRCLEDAICNAETIQSIIQLLVDAYETLVSNSHSKKFLLIITTILCEEWDLDIKQLQKSFDNRWWELLKDRRIGGYWGNRRHGVEVIDTTMEEKQIKPREDSPGPIYVTFLDRSSNTVSRRKIVYRSENPDSNSMPMMPIEGKRFEK